MDCKLPTPFSICKPMDTIYLTRVELIRFGTNSSTTLMLLCKFIHTATKWYRLLTIHRNGQCNSCKNKNIHTATKWSTRGLRSAYVYQITTKLHLQLLGQAIWHHQTLIGSSWCSLLKVPAHVGRISSVFTPFRVENYPLLLSVLCWFLVRELLCALKKSTLLSCIISSKIK